MYGKLFAQMYDGTLGSRGPWQALVTFQQLIILADKTGIVDMTAEAIARRTTVPLDIVELGLSELSKPDEASRSPDEQGRRIVALDPARPWGWRIVNYAKYRQLRNEDERREYHQRYWMEKRSKTQQLNPDSTNSTNGSKQYAVSSKQRTTSLRDESSAAPKMAAEGRVNGHDEDPLTPPAYKCPPCPFEEILEVYGRELPTLPAMRVLTDPRKRAMQTRWRDVCADQEFDKTAGVEFFKRFFAKVGGSKFLTGNSPSRTPGQKPFRADLEWLMKQGNFVKVWEGRYE